MMEERTHATVEIPNPSDIFNDAYIPFVMDYPETLKPTIILEGGRGSGKSRETAQKLVKDSLLKKLRILLIRKVGDTVRDSQYREIQDVVSDWELDDEFRFKTSPLSIRNSVGSEFICRGLDKATKIKSVSNVDIVWIEEAEELTKDDWITLSLSIRGKRGGVMKRIILSFNRSAGNWTEEEFFNEDGSFKVNDDTYHLHTTFQDNKFLDQPFLNRLERMKEEDFELYQKNALGLPIKLKGVVYENWSIVDEFPYDCPEIIYGLDFGFSPDPSVLTMIGRKGMEIFLHQMIYSTKMTNSDVIAKLKLLVPMAYRHREIYADCAEPDRIEEIKRAGFNIFPADKGPGSVEFGIDVCRRFFLRVTAASVEGRKDIENYKFKTDKDGQVITPPVPRHLFSHFPDSFRYPIATHWGKEFRNLTFDEIKTVKIQQGSVSSISEDAPILASQQHSPARRALVSTGSRVTSTIQGY